MQTRNLGLIPIMQTRNLGLIPIMQTRNLGLNHIVADYDSLSIFDPLGYNIHTVWSDANLYLGLALDPRQHSVYLTNYHAGTIIKYLVCCKL